MQVAGVLWRFALSFCVFFYSDYYYGSLKSFGCSCCIYPIVYSFVCEFFLNKINTNNELIC